MSNQMTVSEFASKGGNTTKSKYGVEHYSNMGKKSAAATKKKYGPDYFKEFAKRGLEARLKKAAAKKLGTN